MPSYPQASQMCSKVSQRCTLPYLGLMTSLLLHACYKTSALPSYLKGLLRTVLPVEVSTDASHPHASYSAALSRVLCCSLLQVNFQDDLCLTEVTVYMSILWTDPGSSSSWIEEVWFRAVSIYSIQQLRYTKQPTKMWYVPPANSPQNRDSLALKTAINRNDLTTQFRKLQQLFLSTW